jgi:hypothetical protein
MDIASSHRCLAAYLIDLCGSAVLAPAIGHAREAVLLYEEHHNIISGGSSQQTSGPRRRTNDSEPLKVQKIKIAMLHRSAIDLGQTI